MIALLEQIWHFDIQHVFYAFLYCMHVVMIVYAKKYKCIAEGCKSVSGCGGTV